MNHLQKLYETLQSFEACLLVNNNLCGKLFSSLESPITFDEIFKITSVPFFIPNFNLLSYKLDNFTFKVLYWVIYIDIILEENKIMEDIHNTLTVPCEKSRMVSFASSIMKNIVAPVAGSRFPVKLFFCIAFVSSQVLIVYLNLMLSFYSNY